MAQNSPISYHTEANGRIFIAVGVQCIWYRNISWYYIFIQKCLCIPLKDCPDGYRPPPGAIPGQARYGWVAAISNCASQCDEQERCLGFEFDKKPGPQSSGCYIHTWSLPTRPSKDAYCIKGNCKHRPNGTKTLYMKLPQFNFK